MKVTFKKSPTGAPFFLGYNIGDMADVEDALALDLLDQGIAEAAAEKQEAAAEKATSKQAANAEKR